MLKLTNIVKDYPLNKTESFRALTDINIEFRKSELVAVLGPSGSGKTTLLNIIGGLDRYNFGDLEINGVSTKQYKDRDWDTYRNHSVGFVFQSYNLIMHQTIYSNVELALTLAGVDRKEKDARVRAALDEVGLKGMYNKKPNQLSGGQMQRVAIARAIVNDPEIILADEPTGALDTTNSIQIMEILKNLSKDRLIIMVTHNPDLAHEYATRIINFADGKLVDDSNPLTEDEKTGMAEEAKEARAKFAEVSKIPMVKRLQMEKAEDEKAVVNKGKKKHSSMGLGSAIKLSTKNLISKKMRSILTAVAGSIGIIGIALVLAISSGVKGYLHSMEKNSLSTYPLSINKVTSSGDTTADSLTAIFQMLINKSDDVDRDIYPTEQTVYVQEVVSNLLAKLVGGNATLQENDLVSLNDYLDKHMDSEWGTKSLNYGTTFNVYKVFDAKTDEQGNIIKDAYAKKVAPVKDALTGIEAAKNYDKYLEAFDEWGEIYNNNLMEQQYDLLGNSKFPTEADEICLVVDEYNRLKDTSVFALGLMEASEATALISGGLDVSSITYSFDDLLNLSYYVLPCSSYYTYDTESEVYRYAHVDVTTEEYLQSLVDNNAAIKIKVCGIVRAKEDTNASCLNTVIGYPHALLEKMWELAGDSEVKAEYDRTGTLSSSKIVTDKTYTDDDEFLISIGVTDESNIQRIDIYASSFENKQKIINVINKYNESHESIKYTDSMSNLMTYANTLTDIISRVLIGFAAISLIVSSIMIAIITYTSVLERNKEIGVLRSLGASKHDVSNVFLAEAGLIGVCSGIVGIALTLIFSTITSSILSAVLGFSLQIWIEWYYAIGLIALSVLLSLIAGFIPSRIASKKDPVKALRSE